MLPLSSNPAPVPGIRRSPAAARRRGFTLIEMLIVVAIIITLAGITIFVGGAVKRQMASRATRATLHTLQTLMDEYIKAGNPEPPLGTPDPATKRIASDPDLPLSDKINFVKALRATAGSGGKLQSFTFADDGTPSKNMMILDAFGNPIRFVPSTAANNTSGRFYFFSAGPDGVAYNPPFTGNPATTPLPPDLTADNVFSLDTL